MGEQELRLDVNFRLNFVNSEQVVQLGYTPLTARTFDVAFYISPTVVRTVHECLSFFGGVGIGIFSSDLSFQDEMPRSDPLILLSVDSLNFSMSFNAGLRFEFGYFTTAFWLDATPVFFEPYPGSDFYTPLTSSSMRVAVIWSAGIQF